MSNAGKQKPVADQSQMSLSSLRCASCGGFSHHAIGCQDGAAQITLERMIEQATRQAAMARVWPAGPNRAVMQEDVHLLRTLAERLQRIVDALERDNLTRIIGSSDAEGVLNDADQFVESRASIRALADTIRDEVLR